MGTNSVDKRQFVSMLKINELRKNIEAWDYAYYCLHQPIVSDTEYNKQFKKLVKLESSYPELITAWSPTQRKIAVIEEELRDLKHDISFNSLRATTSENELSEFLTSIGDHVDFVVEPSLVGVGVDLNYKEKQLDIAVTQGTGRKGLIVTNHMRYIRSVPLTIPAELVLCRVRGSVVIPREVFTRLKGKAGKTTTEVVNSILTSDNLMDVVKYKLRFFANDMIAAQSHITNQQLKLGFILNSLRIPVVPQYLCKSPISVQHTIEELRELRPQLPYDINGAVIKVLALSLQKSIGGKIPKWAIIYSGGFDE